ncbi:ubiquitin carboxyl-terminal hydrolase 18-like [Momordica charantia]|uniref:ubiquitinyl hydrolase 1 n=1 Tax=Momordica charantia TaxID=3673 RepID=A0A6J1CE46_MOMCH|nr:ubiquitin carboxyl-terminal hydrolase 18-like [Momordica charantia]XP_022138796.1 ubiquitin carboxyl-terminal hydrolase 18-like [Momordica charantia]
MHVSGVSLDLNWFLQLIFTAFVILFGLLHLVKNTASKYFEVDANFEASGGGPAGRGARGGGGDGGDCNSMSGDSMAETVCVVCGNLGSKVCSRCKAVRYCSPTCQEIHWKAGHKTKCKDFQACRNINDFETANNHRDSKASTTGSKIFSAIALVPSHRTSKHIKQPKDILFPYDEFLNLFYWDKHQFRPCGLLNCGNSCFANVVLQCLSFTRPLFAFLYEKGHKNECVRDDWCFLCEFQTHVERASRSVQPFSPNNIILRLPNIGGNLGYGRQEDAHEFMRFAIDRMQMACLDEFGGEKAVRSHSRETTIVQHIFGGQLQSQVICTNCNNVSNQHENMMDLTVEIHGDAASLEECLDQFTKVELLHGDNMYKCDGCNDYVKASKRLMVKQAPNILTIALKRFQSGRFGKLNKKVTFPETLDLSPYVSEAGDRTDVYRLYAVVVHVDMLNASFFGHYICYIKDFSGNWYRTDDCKVTKVELEEVLSQGAYMILYSRARPRTSSLRTIESMGNNHMQKEKVESDVCANEQVESAKLGLVNRVCSNSESTDGCIHSDNFSGSPNIRPQPVRVYSEDMNGDTLDSSTSNGVSSYSHKPAFRVSSEAVRENVRDMDLLNVETSSSVPKDISCVGQDSPLLSNHNPLITIPIDTSTARENGNCHSAVPMEVSYGEDISVNNLETARDDSEDTEMVNCETSSLAPDINVNVNGHIHGDETVRLSDHTNIQLAANNQNNYSFNETSAAETRKMNPGSLCLSYASGTNQVELMGDV